MIFRIITGISVLVTIFLLTRHRFRNTRDTSRKEPDKSSRVTYIPWLFRRTVVFLKTTGTKGWIERYRRWVGLRHARRERWIILCMGISFCFLAASGFFYSLSGSQRLNGLILLLHVTAGGLFAACLSLAVLLRARHYRPNADKIKRDKDALVPERQSSFRVSWPTLFFWISVASGLCLIITALSLMLPYFTVNFQLDMFEAHRYSALVALLSAIAFGYFNLLDTKK